MFTVKGIIERLKESLSSDKLNKIPTDDEMLVYELMGVHAKVGTGSIYNIKITTREDMYMAERIADILGLT